MSNEKTKHTPGPWHHWDPLGEREWAVTTTGPRPELGGPLPNMPIRVASEIDSEANARLIAAAPELLALAHLVVTQTTADENGDMPNHPRGVLLVLLDAARAAIAKAEGRS